MRKFTTILSAVMLSLGVSAFAQSTTNIQPTISPEPGYVTDQLPTEVTISWGNNSLSFVEDIESFEITTMLGDSFYMYEGEPSIATISNNELKIENSNDIWLYNGAILKFVIPAGIVNIGNEGSNEEFDIEYTYFELYNEFVLEPRQGSTVFSLSSVQLRWDQDDTSVSKVNPDCTKKIQVGYDMDNMTDVQTVTVEDGVATITFDKEYNTTGSLTFYLPAEYFLIETPAGEIANPYEDTKSFTISPVQISPKTGYNVNVFGPLSSFTICAETSIALVNNDSSKISIVDDNGNSYTIQSVNNTELMLDDNNCKGLEFILSEPCYDQGLRISVSSGTLNVNGSVYNEDLYWEYILINPTVTPKTGDAEIESIQEISLYWNNAGDSYEIQINPEAGTPSLSDGTTSVNISGEIVETTTKVNNPVWGLIDQTSYTLVFDVENYITEPGNYTLTIPAGYVEVSAYDPSIWMNNWFPTNEIVLNYKVYVSDYIVEEPKITPADNSTLYGSPQNVVLTYQQEIELAENFTTPVTVSYNNGTAVNVPADKVFILNAGTFDEATNTEKPEPPYTLNIDWANLTYAASGATNAGTYTITIPEGLIVNAKGQVNNPETLTYTVYATQGEESVTPAPQAEDGEINYFTSEELEAVTITFPSNLTAVQNPPIVFVFKQSNDDSGVMPLAATDGYLDSKNIKVTGKTIVLNLSELTDGEWYVEIPAGYAQINNTTYTSKVTFIYHVANGLATPTLLGIENNATYSTVNKPELAILTWGYQPLTLGTGNVTVEIYDPATKKSNTQTVKSTDISLVYAAPETSDQTPGVATRADEETPNALEINLASYTDVTAMSNVTVTVPAGLVSAAGQSNNEVVIQYNILPLYTGEAEFLNAEGEVSIYWGNNTITVNADAEAAYVSDTEGNTYELTYANVQGSEQGDITEIPNTAGTAYTGLIADLNNLELKDGDYTLWIPMAYVTIDGQYVNDTAYWQFTVTDGAIEGDTSAISSIVNVEAPEGVYNLHGVKVSNDLNSLAPGIYVINGKKVLVK